MYGFSFQKALSTTDIRSSRSFFTSVYLAIAHANLRGIFRKGIADEQLAKMEQERGRKRERQSEDPEFGGASKRMRSASASSVSVSTISTNLSQSLPRSPSPLQG